MDTIAPCAPAEDDNAIFWLDTAGMAPVWQQPQASTEDERIKEIATIIKNCSIDSRDAHFVTVVTNTIHHAAGNAARRENALGQFLNVCIRRPEAKHICAGNGLRRNSQHIADHSSNTSIRSTKWLNCRRMIMRFDFEGNIV